MRHVLNLRGMIANSCVLFGLGSIVSAQDYGVRIQQPQVQREALQCSGTVKQVGRGVIGVTADSGDQWLVQVEARPQDLSFTGTAEASFVKPGMWIRFTSKLTRRGDAKDPIASAEIYTPGEGNGVGVYAEGTDQVGGGGERGGLFTPAEEKPVAKAKPKAEPKVRDEDTVYRVGGQVSKISRLGELTISAGGTSVKAKLAEDAKISVNMGDLAYLQVGDKIEFRGWYPAGTKGQAVANQVTASASQPLTDTSKKKKPAPAVDKPAAEGDQPKADKPADGEKKPEKAEAKKPDEKPAAVKKDE